jgi:hypothetical protein
LRIEFPTFALWAELPGVRVQGHTNFRVLNGTLNAVIKETKLREIIQTKQGATRVGREVGYLHQTTAMGLMKRAATNVVSI